jgi:glycosyltransferase involved in cell wall biosynthesis
LQADWIITVIDEAVERYIALGVPPEKITVVPNYVNLEEFLPEKFDESILSKFKEDFKLVYTGGFDTHRGLETLLEAAAILKSRIENLKVLLVGSGSNYDSLRELSQKLELDKVVSFEGWQPVEKLPSYIAASDIGIIPHLKTVHTDNTIPHKLFQYMFLEKPVIATDCAPLVRIIKESNAGLIYPSGNAQALAERIYELYTKPSLREEMGLNGKNAVLQKYNWEKAAGNLIRLYEKIS